MRRRSPLDLAIIRAFGQEVAISHDTDHDVIFVYVTKGKFVFTYKATIYSDDNGFLDFRHLTHRGLRDEIYRSVPIPE